MPDVAPDLPMSFTERAYWLHAEQRDAEAMRLIDAALKAEPGLTGALYLRGVIALAHGDYERGLPLHELRLQRLGAMRYPTGKLWDGKSTTARLRLWAEQGYGDTLMMLRYLPLVRQRCPKVTVEVQAPLVRLCRENGIDAVALGADADFDRHWPLMSLPYLAGTRPDTIPAPVYLRAEAEPAPYSLRMGVCWSSASTQTQSRIARCVPKDLLDPLAASYDFLSLQAEENEWEDFADTARAIAGLDLVITIDTALAHLAGSLGVPTWLMLAVDCDWRWGRKAASPWYPAMRLFRQPTPGDWASVIQQVKEALDARARPAVAA